VKIRRVAASEWRSCRDLRLDALKSDPLAFGSNFRRENDYPPMKWKAWAKKGAIGNDSATFVAEGPARRLVGMAGVFTDRNEYHVWGMWVAPEFRDRGLGRSLLDRILSWAQATSPDREVYLDVNPDQSTAVRLYESRGFRPTGKTSSLGHHAPATVQEMRRDTRSATSDKPSRRRSRRVRV
jgi:ribosomal protein S18 acetylase RimI-like enzyme